MFEPAVTPSQVVAPSVEDLVERTTLAEGPRIVIAEDDPTTRLILASVLTAEGYQVAEATNGAEALALAREARPALIILDVEMPGADGFAVCRAIRGESMSEGPPILILTGREQEDAVTLAFEAGATDFASKPLAPGLLLHRVRFLLRNDAVVEQRVTARMAVDAGVRQAVEREEFLLYYQPQVAADGRIFGAEALLRSFLPDGTLVSAARVMPAIEESGLIHTVVEWTLRTGLRQMAVWDRAGLVLPSLAVNLSARQLGNPGIVERFAGMVREAGIRPERITFEVLESALLEQPSAGSILEDFRKRGFRIAMDHFGTGLSALSHLQKFPIDALKIDRSLIRDLPGDTGQAAIVRAIISLAIELGIEPIVEGVEEQRQRDFLVGAGCRVMQGFLFGKALPAEEFVKLLTAEALPRTNPPPLASSPAGGTSRSRSEPPAA